MVNDGRGRTRDAPSHNHFGFSGCGGSHVGYDIPQSADSSLQ